MSKPGGGFSRTQIFLWIYKRNSAPLISWLQDSWLPELWADKPLLFKPIALQCPKKSNRATVQRVGASRGLSAALPAPSVCCLLLAGPWWTFSCRWGSSGIQQGQHQPASPFSGIHKGLSLVSFPIIAHVGTPDLGILTYFLFVLLALYCGSCCFTLCPDILLPGPKVVFLYCLPVDKLTGGNGKQTILGSLRNSSCILKKPW